MQRVKIVTREDPIQLESHLPLLIPPLVVDC